MSAYDTVIPEFHPFQDADACPHPHVSSEAYRCDRVAGLAIGNRLRRGRMILITDRYPMILITDRYPMIVITNGNSFGEKTVVADDDVVHRANDRKWANMHVLAHDQLTFDFQVRMMTLMNVCADPQHGPL